MDLRTTRTGRLAGRYGTRCGSVYPAVNVRAYVAAPRLKGGGYVASFGVHQSEPRVPPGEVALVEDRAVASVTISRVSVEYCRWAKPAEQQLIDERRGRESRAIHPISTSAFQHFVLAELLSGLQCDLQRR